MPKVALPLVTGQEIAKSNQHSIGNGNIKLGKRIGTFSLPAIHTCELGSTPTCRDLCYACTSNSFFMMSNVIKRYQTNLAFSHTSEFVDSMVKQIRKKKLIAFRWHVSGDLYSPAYAAKILSVISRTPEVNHYLYTRTWRSLKMRPIISAIASQPNVLLWLSCDRDTGEPVEIPESRRAYLQVSEDDVPSYNVDLVFRDAPLRETVVKRVSGAIVCPVENGVTNTTCQKCQICINPNRLNLPENR